MKLFFGTRWIHSWETCWQESCHVHDCFPSKSKSIKITLILSREKFIISNCSSRHEGHSCEKPSENILQFKQKTCAQSACSVQKKVLMQVERRFLQFFIRTPGFCFEKCAKRFCKFPKKFGQRLKPFIKLFSFQNKSQKVPLDTQNQVFTTVLRNICKVQNLSAALLKTMKYTSTSKKLLSWNCSSVSEEYNSLKKNAGKNLLMSLKVFAPVSKVYRKNFLIFRRKISSSQTVPFNAYIAVLTTQLKFLKQWSAKNPSIKFQKKYKLIFWPQIFFLNMFSAHVESCFDNPAGCL